MHFKQLIGLLSLLAVTTTAIAQYATSLYVDRITYAGAVDGSGNPTYRRESGTLYSDGSGFVPYISLNHTVYGWDSNAPTVSQLRAVNGLYIIKVAEWTILVKPPFSQDNLRNYTRSETIYTIGGDQYYAVQVGGTNSDNGPIIVPVAASGPRFLNMSFRAVVPANGNIIPGFVVADTPNHTKQTILIRVAGPTLATFGVTGTLSDPKITVYDSKNNIVATNDNWCDNATEKNLIETTRPKVGAFAFSDNSKDAAILLSLSPGTYTAMINGPRDASGEVLVEVYTVEK